MHSRLGYSRNNEFEGNFDAHSPTIKNTKWKSDSESPLPFFLSVISTWGLNKFDFRKKTFMHFWNCNFLKLQVESIDLNDSFEYRRPLWPEVARPASTLNRFLAHEGAIFFYITLFRDLSHPSRFVPFGGQYFYLTIPYDFWRN